jgi:hypothetical protein
MPFSDKDDRDTAINKPPLWTPRLVQQKYIYPSDSIDHIWQLDSNDQDSHTGKNGPRVVGDIDERSESMDEYEVEDEVDEDDDLLDEDNDWSGEDGGLEELVLSVVEGDLTFAASLIPALHRYMRSRLRSKVESWQSCAAGGSHNSSHKSNSVLSSSSKQHDSPANSRKRKTSLDRGENPGEGEDEDKDGEGRQHADNIASSDRAKQPMLACPFNKRNPTKYCANYHIKYRTCAGPGFRNIQRLRYVFLLHGKSVEEAEQVIV